MTPVAQDIPVDRCRASPNARPIKIGQVEVLKASIREVGLRQPINVREVDGGYEVRGGGHRVEAFRQLGRETIPAFIRNDDDLHAELAEIDENLIRNDLSPIERDIAIARRKAIYELLHPETVKGATGKSRPKVRQNGEPNGKPVKRFTKATAEATGESERTVQRSVARVETLGEETMTALAETSLNAPAELDALVALPPEKRAEVIERAKAGDKVKATVELKKENRDEKERVLGAKQRDLPDERFGVIYADIPRHFHVHSDITGMDRAPENHYPTMTFQQLVDLPVQDIAADDCILVFWSTAASLIDDLEIMAEWGFVVFRPREAGRLRRDVLIDGKWCVGDLPGGAQPYRSMQVWDKVNMGLGYWFRDQHEFILVGARGNVVPPAQGTQDRSLFSEKKGEHSAKPKCVADMIDRHWPTIPKIELFARDARPGWKVWGFEAPQESEPEAQREAEVETLPPASHADEATASAMASCTQDVGATDQPHGVLQSPQQFTADEREANGVFDPNDPDSTGIPIFCRRQVAGPKSAPITPAGVTE